MPSPSLPAGAKPRPIEDFLSESDLPRPHAILGVVENGCVRPLAADAKLPESAKVLIVGQWAGGETPS